VATGHIARVGVWADAEPTQDMGREEQAKDMPENSTWRELLQEPNAIGWIAFLILVISIGVGSLIFDRGSSPNSRMERTAHSVPNQAK
jgi:hypothetical protein